MDIKPIETQYKGYRFRSRLEARWAVFFDAMGIEWEYEKEGFDLGDAGWYLPDFWLPRWGMWIEVKPQVPTEDEIYKMWKLAAAFKGDRENGWHEHAIFCGTPGKPCVHFGATKPLITTPNGYTALTVTGGTIDGRPMITFSAFAMMDGGRHLDIWPMYMPVSEEDFLSVPYTLVPIDVYGNRKDLLSLTLYHGFIGRLYVGRGVRYFSPNLMMAYGTARSARFEHGETPRVTKRYF